MTQQITRRSAATEKQDNEVRMGKHWSRAAVLSALLPSPPLTSCSLVGKPSLCFSLCLSVCLSLSLSLCLCIYLSLLTFLFHSVPGKCFSLNSLHMASQTQPFLCSQYSERLRILIPSFSKQMFLWMKNVTCHISKQRMLQPSSHHPL